MKRQVLVGLVGLLTGCAPHASSTTVTSQLEPREGRGVEYPKEISLGARMHIEAWGCKGFETGSIALSPPPMDLNDPQTGPGAAPLFIHSTSRTTSPCLPNARATTPEAHLSVASSLQTSYHRATGQSKSLDNVGPCCVLKAGPDQRV